MYEKFMSWYLDRLCTALYQPRSKVFLPKERELSLYFNNLRVLYPVFLLYQKKRQIYMFIYMYGTADMEFP